MTGKCITRRSVLKNTALGALSMLGVSYLASAETKKVWLDMTQEELDRAYSQAAYAPNMRQVIARWGTNSALVRSRIGDPLRLSYGNKPIESLDVFPTKLPDAPVHVYIHGGAWRQGKAENYAFPAEMFINAGAHYVVPDFSWVQDVDESHWRQGLRRISWRATCAGRGDFPGQDGIAAIRQAADDLVSQPDGRLGTALGSGLITSSTRCLWEEMTQAGQTAPLSARNGRGSSMISFRRP